MKGRQGLSSQQTCRWRADVTCRYCLGCSYCSAIAAFARSMPHTAPLIVLPDPILRRVCQPRGAAPLLSWSGALQRGLPSRARRAGTPRAERVRRWVALRDSRERVTVGCR